MVKRKSKKIPDISSADEATEAVNNWYSNAPSFDPYDCPEISDFQMERLQTLIRKIWEDAYREGRYDAGIEFVEGEWSDS